MISDDGEEPSKETDSISTKYKLVGVVVHSGQASGGHYYSFILHRWACFKYLLFNKNVLSFLKQSSPNYHLMTQKCSKNDKFWGEASAVVDIYDWISFTVA